MSKDTDKKPDKSEKPEADTKGAGGGGFPPKPQ
jgi:hypothetical protein